MSEAQYKVIVSEGRADPHTGLTSYLAKFTAAEFGQSRPGLAQWVESAPAIIAYAGD